MNTKTKNNASVGRILAWGTRPIALGSITIIIGYLSLYCTNTLHMEPALVGTLLMASKIFDGVTDLVAGWLVDNTNSKWGKGRPYELSLIGAWVCTWALFSTPERWGTVGKSVWLFVFYTLVFSVFYTLLNAGETPYIIRAFGDAISVSKVSSYVGIFVTIGSVVIAMLFPMMVGSMATSAAGWSKLIAMFGVPLTIFGMIRFFLIKETYVDENEGNEQKAEKLSLKEIAVAIKSKYIWLASIGVAIANLIMGMSVGSYYFTDVVGDIAKMSTVTMVTSLNVLAMVIFPILLKKYSVMQIAAGVSVVGAAGYFINFIAGGNMGLLMIGALLGSFAALPFSYLRSVICMQIADYNEANHMARMEATLAAVMNFLAKIGSALGSFMVGVMLSMGGYDGNLSTQPDSALFMIKVLYGLIPAVLTLITVPCAIGFRPLDKWTKERQGKGE
ncbi:MAG: MFS transporter [Blautia sp.]|nr:MFS transporter [Blautia sp.]